MKSKKKTEAVPEEPSGSAPETDAERRSYGWIFAVALAVIIIAGLSYGYTVITDNNRLTKVCSDLSASIDLKYPTVCVPLAIDSSGGDYIDTRSEPMCRCSVDTGNGTGTVIDVRVAK